MDAPLADTGTLATSALPTPRRRRARPLLRAYLTAYEVTLRAAGEALGVSHEQVRLFCLPFDDARRAEPDADVARRIALWTDGAVQPWTFEDTPGSRAIGLAGITGLDT
jgi:hypothetical protein